MVTTRLALPEEALQFVQWVTSTPNNGFDPQTAQYPNARCLCVEVDGKPAIYVPFHPVMSVGAVARDPNGTAEEYATAVKAAAEALEQISMQYGMSEMLTFSAYRPIVRILKRLGCRLAHGQTLIKRVGK
jgi:hypothetical protein